MQVIKRDGKRVPVQFDRILERIERLSKGLNVDCAKLTQVTIGSMYNGIATADLDIIAANKAEEMKLTEHPDYAILAARILISNLHKTTPATFSQCMEELNRREPKRIRPEYMQYFRDNAATLDSIIVHERDYDFDYVGATTMLRVYLHTSNDVVIDRPQYMFLRAAIQTCGRDSIEWVKRIYESLSLHKYTHATPTLMNSCMRSGQLSSCFLIGTGDSQAEIMRTMKDAAYISKNGGGVAVHMSNIRAAGQQISSTGGAAAGIIPQLRVYNNHARLWDQGGNKRLAAYAFYIMPHHADIIAFLQLLLHSGSHLERAHDINTALWIPDLFVKRLITSQTWSLFSEDTAPMLSDAYDGMEVCTKCGYCSNSAYAKIREILDASGPSAPSAPPAVQVQPCTDEHSFSSVDAYTRLYEHYERTGKAVRTISPNDIIAAITASKAETGKPYICFSDHVNRQSNQKAIGTIKSSNLCTEIMEVSDGKNIAVCTIASVNLTHFVRDGEFDFDGLGETVRQITRALDNVVSLSPYPSKRCHANTEAYRPIGIGVQGLANVFCKLKMPYCSDAATALDMRIMETIYYHALSASADLAVERGPHEGWRESPAGRGILRFDLWRQNNPQISLSYVPGADWEPLRARIRKTGLRCSLHVALMPTASTSQLFGNNESFEPFRAHVGTNAGVSGRLTVANMTMVRHLLELGLWTPEVRNYVMTTGEVPESLPQDIRELYDVVWNMKQRYLQERASLRSMFIDQSQSLNLYVREVSAATEATLLVNGWKAGLMTCSYYTHSKAAVMARKNISVVSGTGSAAGNAGTSSAASAATDGDVCRPGCDSCSA